MPDFVGCRNFTAMPSRSTVLRFMRQSVNFINCFPLRKPTVFPADEFDPAKDADALSDAFKGFGEFKKNDIKEYHAKHIKITQVYTCFIILITAIKLPPICGMLYVVRVCCILYIYENIDSTCSVR